MQKLTWSDRYGVETCAVGRIAILTVAYEAGKYKAEVKTGARAYTLAARYDSSDEAKATAVKLLEKMLAEAAEILAATGDAR